MDAIPPVTSIDVTQELFNKMTPIPDIEFPFLPGCPHDTMLMDYMGDYHSVPVAWEEIPQETDQRDLDTPDTNGLLLLFIIIIVIIIIIILLLYT